MTNGSSTNEGTTNKDMTNGGVGQESAAGAGGAAAEGAAEPTPRRVYRVASRGEAVVGMLWLCVGAIISMFLEVIYLSTWIFGVAVPYTIIIAFFFNMVLTKTALLWTKNTLFAMIPLWAWMIGILLMAFIFSFTGDQLVGSNIRSILLMVAGAAGGSWPLFVKK